ncbi:MAG TPA: FAD-dependent oxidoreductase [Saprospiraceae bacterium]|jgi:hypothetical protein|nr:FAD-dependent oxidoreductase [Saprospiraceae bacterium]HRK80180.1 FAD-dependent oxidoreductase [Saprospiraceae bacterium]
MQYELSHWEYDSFFRAIDVAVLGSGIVGLSTAVRLKELQPSLNVALIERGALPLGASTRNAGFACFGSMTELLDDLRLRSEEEVWQLVEMRWKGLLRLRERIGDAALAYEPLGGYEIFRASETSTFQECADHLSMFNQKMQSITGKADTYQIVSEEKARSFGFNDVPHLIWNSLEGQIHTGSMMAAWMRLAQQHNVLLLNGINIESIHPESDAVVLKTSAGWDMRVPSLVVTVNGFAQRLLPELDVQPARNQVLVTKPIAGLSMRGAFHYDRGYYYFRNVGPDRILLGGGRHLDLRGEMTDHFGTTSLIREKLLSLLDEMIAPGLHAEPERWWSGIMGVGETKRPIVQKLHPRLTVAVRMGGMGVAIGTQVGEEAANLALG